MIDIDKNKLEVFDCWLEHFPALTQYSKGKFYLILKPFIAGIELIKLPRNQSYRPHFVLYPLYRADLKGCLNYPELLIEILKQNDKTKGLQYDIRYDSELELTFKAIEDFKTQIGFDFHRDLQIESLNTLIDSVIKSTIVVAGLRQPVFFELKFLLNLYVSDDHANDILAEIHNASKNWDSERFIDYYGDFTLWLDRLKSYNRVSFHDKIDKMSLEEKFKKLKSLSII